MGKMIKECQSFEMDFPFCEDDIVYGQRCQLLKAVQLSLYMYSVKAFKGEKRKEKLLQCIFSVQQMIGGEEDYQEKTLQKIEEDKERYTSLPQSILQKISNIEDLYFGEYPEEIYCQLKQWFYEEREFLRAVITGKIQK